MTRHAPTIVSLLGIALVAVGMVKIVGDQRTHRELEALRGRILVARMAADSCRGSLEYRQERFHAFGAALDSMRSEVRDLEALDPRGVPEARYQEYMARFEAYNDSVATWDARVEALRTEEEACRGLVEAHNVLSDSLRRRMEEERGDG